MIADTACPPDPVLDIELLFAEPEEVVEEEEEAEVDAAAAAFICDGLLELGPIAAPPGGPNG